MIAERLGRSVQEVYRMVASLERRGYIVRHPPADAFWLSTKLYELASAYPPVQRLTDAAGPIMQRLSFEAHQAFQLRFSTARGSGRSRMSITLNP